MLIGTRLPGFANEIGFDAYAQWLAENGFDAVDTPVLTGDIAKTCAHLGLTLGTCDISNSGVLSADTSTRKRPSRE